MDNNKKFNLQAHEITRLIPLMGGCLATDKITVDGLPVRFMYRAEPHNEMDSGWQFFSGTEDQVYIDEPNNTGVYDVNTIANHDKAIIPYLNSPIGTDLERISGTEKFRVVRRSLIQRLLSIFR